jgi:putative Mg2+ transporter-C (MgtC) family protein
MVGLAARRASPDLDRRARCLIPPRRCSTIAAERGGRPPPATVIEPLTLEEMLLRLVAAMLMGALLGINREQRGKPAGLKTMTLVSVGAASFMLVSLELFLSVPDTVGGIGFLGAGSIIRARGSVVGMTTAATIWTVGAVGLACGLGQFRLALLITLVAWVILVGFGFVERTWLGHPSGRREPPPDEPSPR